jgi:hypothetical protein
VRSILLSWHTQWQPANLAVDWKSTLTLRIDRAQFKRLKAGGDQVLAGSGMGWVGGRQGRDEGKSEQRAEVGRQRQGGEVG